MAANGAKCSTAELTMSLNFTGRDAVEGIDFFYQDPANLRIAVLFAVEFIVDKMNGKSAAELDRMLTSMRKTANKQ